MTWYSQEGFGAVPIGSSTPPPSFQPVGSTCVRIRGRGWAWEKGRSGGSGLIPGPGVPDPQGRSPSDDNQATVGLTPSQFYEPRQGRALRVQASQAARTHDAAKSRSPYLPGLPGLTLSGVSLATPQRTQATHVTWRLRFMVFCAATPFC